MNQEEMRNLMEKSDEELRNIMNDDRLTAEIRLAAQRILDSRCEPDNLELKNESYDNSELHTPINESDNRFINHFNPLSTIVIFFGIIISILLMYVTVIFIQKVRHVGIEKIDKWYASENIKSLKHYVQRRLNSIPERELTTYKYAVKKLIEKRDSTGYMAADSLFNRYPDGEWKHQMIELMILQNHIHKIWDEVI
jgi:hypothetical protein